MLMIIELVLMINSVLVLILVSFLKNWYYNFYKWVGFYFVIIYEILIKFMFNVF